MVACAYLQSQSATPEAERQGNHLGLQVRDLPEQHSETPSQKQTNKKTQTTK